MAKTTVADFSKKFNVPTSTLYYYINNDIVKMRMEKTKYGKRKTFNEEEMLKTLDERIIEYTLPEVVQ